MVFLVVLFDVILVGVLCWRLFVGLLGMLAVFVGMVGIVDLLLIGLFSVLFVCDC